MSHLVLDLCIFVIISIEVDEAVVLPGPLGSVEDVGDAQLLKESQIFDGLFVGYEESGDDLVTVTAPALGWEASLTAWETEAPRYTTPPQQGTVPLPPGLPSLLTVETRFRLITRPPTRVGVAVSRFNATHHIRARKVAYRINIIL